MLYAILSQKPFKINKDLIEVLLILKVPLAQYPKLEELFCRTASWSEFCQFFCHDCFCLRLPPVPSAWLYLGDILGWLCDSSCTVEGYLSWVMIRDWFFGMGHSPACHILLQILCKALITASPPAWISSPGILPVPGDFLFLSDFTAALTSSRKIG